jgi:hypothetical protein
MYQYDPNVNLTLEIQTEPVVQRRLAGSGLFAVVGFTVALLALLAWLPVRLWRLAVPQTIALPAWLIGRPPTTLLSSSVDLGFLPPDLAVPPRLPAGLPDAMLLEAWVRLYNEVEPIQLWGDRAVNGRVLAQYLLDQAIPVVWDVGQVCHAGACSRMYCLDQVCTYADATPGVDPIYIHPVWRDDMPALVGLLAHEIFHRTQAFGRVGDTRFEEYWALFIQTQVSPTSWLRFGQFDPLVPGQLVLWYETNHLERYLQLESYPAGITPLGRVGAGVGAPLDSIPPEAKSFH